MANDRLVLRCSGCLESIVVADSIGLGAMGWNIPADGLATTGASLSAFLDRHAACGSAERDWAEQRQLQLVTESSCVTDLLLEGGPADWPPLRD